MKRTTLLLLVWLLSAIDFSKAHETMVFQSAPEEIIRGKPIYLTFAIPSKECDPVRVSIFYKTDVDALFKEFKLVSHQGVYRFPIIPEMTVGANFFYYFLIIECADGKIYGFPPANPKGKPLKIKIVDKVVE